MKFADQEDEWNDLVPIPQNDGPSPVVSIAYSDEFVHYMDIFRAVVHKGELSLRALELTETLLELNPANYTIWQYRRECLKALKCDLNKELDFMDNFTEENPKNYQIWYHRRATIELLGNGSREMDFTSRVFDIDCKNYHAWAHRQWALQRFELWQGELEFINKLLQEDLRNNSAWNQRWFYIHKNTLEPINDEVLHREVNYTLEAINTLRLNESAWNYLRGLINEHILVKETVLPKLQEWVEGVDSDNPLAVSLLADMREMECTESSLDAAEVLFNRLCEIDKIRKKCWIRRIMEVRLKKEAIKSLL
mmetsp:Transcript_23240/g.33286  ORF Transcript_23240/g.33286 Transcript_23240/m.33286 type:complete len:308 (-) Transcript_23240:83-1006(-)